MANIDLEMFKEIFKDKRTHLSVAKIKKLSVASDRSFLKCLVSIFPEQREVIARMTWAMTGPNSGIVEFPSVDDLVLIGFADGDNDQAFVISRMSSKEDNLPLKAIDGHLVVKAKDGKEFWATSNTRINLSKTDAVPTENLVLGQQLKALLINLLAKNKELSLKVKELSEQVAAHTHIGNLGYPTSAPNQAGDFTELGSDFEGIGNDYQDLSDSPVEDEIILSDLSFTEKGS